MNKKINIFVLLLSSLLIFPACNFSSNSGTKNIEKDGKHFVISGDILRGDSVLLQLLLHLLLLIL